MSAALTAARGSPATAESVIVVVATDVMGVRQTSSRNTRFVLAQGLFDFLRRWDPQLGPCDVKRLAR